MRTARRTGSAQLRADGSAGEVDGVDRGEESGDHFRFEVGAFGVGALEFGAVDWNLHDTPVGRKSVP
jgi:hypothetical protein